MLLEGHQINQYRFIRLIRSGGMGEVYLAYDEHLDRQVAVKVIRTDTSSYPDTQAAREAARLFLREMQAIARLDHMNILPVYGSGEKSVNGAKLMFMVMPYRRQGSLADWLQKRDTARPLSLKDTERIVKQAANALQHPHYHVPPQPPSAINPIIPQELDAVLLRALSKNSDERYRSVAAFARAFQQAMPNSDRPLANNSIEGAASPVTRPKVAPTIPVRNANDDAIPFSQRRRGLAGKGIFVILLALVLIGASILGFLVLRSYPSKNINSLESHTNIKETHIVSPSIGSAAT